MDFSLISARIESLTKAFLANGAVKPCVSVYCLLVSSKRRFSSKPHGTLPTLKRSQVFFMSHSVMKVQLFLCGVTPSASSAAIRFSFMHIAHVSLQISLATKLAGTCLADIWLDTVAYCLCMPHQQGLRSRSPESAKLHRSGTLPEPAVTHASASLRCSGET